MGQPTEDRNSAASAIHDRRYAIRYAFSANAELLDLDSGSRSTGITSDISLGGCFVCTSRPLAVRMRVRLKLIFKGEQVEILATVRAVKPRVGMGLEFLDVEGNSYTTLVRWIEELRRSR
ncbi:MAG: PilZ domain-containing protein [Acidobacteriia bacterium]|nr:PilZ domain-containing protein [Terriglobia bacterium]